MSVTPNEDRVCGHRCQGGLDVSRDRPRAPWGFCLVRSCGVSRLLAQAVLVPTPSTASWSSCTGHTLSWSLSSGSIWLPALYAQGWASAGVCGWRHEGRPGAALRMQPCLPTFRSVLVGGVWVLCLRVTCPHTSQHLMRSFNGGSVLTSCFILLSDHSSVDLSAGLGGPTLHPHQSRVSCSGQRAGDVGTAELAVPGRDGQLLAQYGTAAEDAVRASQAGQLLPRSRCGPSQSPGRDRAKRGNGRLSGSPGLWLPTPCLPPALGARHTLSTLAYIPQLSGRARLENYLQIQLFS